MIGLLTTALLFMSVVPAGAQDEGPQPEDPQPGDTQPQNPVEVFLASVTLLGNMPQTPEQIAALHQQGYGMGNISKAIYLQQNGDTRDLQTILALAKEIGWGKLFKEAGLHGGGVGWLFKNNGQHGLNGKSSGWTPPGLAKKNQNINNNGSMPPGQQKNKDKNNGNKKGGK